MPDQPAEPMPSEPLSDLYGRYRKDLVAFVRAKFGPAPPDAEDVAQQAFMTFAALEYRDRIENPRAFLYRMARNIVLNERKHEKIGRQFLLPESAEIHAVRDDLSPEVVLQDRERYALVEAAIRAMPRQRRMYLLMNRVEGLSFAEIARRVGLTESAIRKHVALAVRECGAALLEKGAGDE